jgi:biotin carboxyl carrier protein
MLFLNQKKGLINMDCIRINMKKILFLFFLQRLLSSAICHPGMTDFFDAVNTHRAPFLQRDIHIPVGEKEDEIHHLFLPTGTPLQEIASKISKKREEIGLSPDIPLDQQDDFFYYFNWQTRKNTPIKSPLPARMDKVFVYQGQQVQSGDPLCTLVAMKMEILITSPSSGEITDIFSAENDDIERNATLITLLGWENISRDHIVNDKDLLLLLFPWVKSSLGEAPPPPHEPPPDGEKRNENLNTFSEEVVSKTPHEVNVEGISPPSVSYPVSLEETKPALNSPTESHIPVPQNHIEVQGEPSLNSTNIIENKEKMISKVTLFVSEAPHETNVDVLSPPSVSYPVFLKEPRPALNSLQIQETVAPQSFLPDLNPTKFIENKEKIVSKAYKISTRYLHKLNFSAPHAYLKNDFLTQGDFKTSQKRPFIPYKPFSEKKNHSIEQERIFPLIKEKPSLQMKSLIPRVKKLLKDAPVSELNDEEEISPGTWAKWMSGLVILGLLLLSLKTMITYKLRWSQLKRLYDDFFFLGKIKCLRAIDFNKQNLIMHKVAHNVNYQWWQQKKTTQRKNRRRLIL